MPSCGSHVGIRQDEQGCYLLSVDGIAYRICPGSQVSCDPNGLGIVIDGVLCPFPGGSDGEGNVVTSLSFDPDTLILSLEQSEGPSFDVNLDVLASDFYADSVTFDADTRELTITRTGGLPPLTTVIPSDATELPEGTEGQVIGYDEDGQLVAVDLPEPPADEDHYVESAAFDEETRILTLTRTDPLDPLTVEIPSEFQFPETGTPFFLLQRGAAGGVLTEGRLFLGTLSVTSAYPDDAIVPAVPGGAADTAPFGRLRATADPTRITLAKRGNTGTLKAADAVEPDDLVTLAQLEANAVELPEGDPFDVIQYDADGEPVAGKVAPQNLTYTAIPAEEQLGPFNVPGMRSIINDAFYWLPATHINWQPDQYSIAVRDRDGTLKAAPAEDPDDLVTLTQLQEYALPEGPGILTSDGTTALFKKPDLTDLTEDQRLESASVVAAIPAYYISGAQEGEPRGYYWANAAAGAHTVAVRVEDGRLNVGTPVSPSNATTKDYVDDLVAEAAVPEGTEFDVLRYGEDGAPEAGRIDLRHIVDSAYTILTDQVLVPVYVYDVSGTLTGSGAFTATHVPGPNSIASYEDIQFAGVQRFVLRSQTIAKTSWLENPALAGLTAVVNVAMFRDVVDPLITAIDALDPIADPSSATVEDVAIKVNEVITALKSLLP